MYMKNDMTHHLYHAEPLVTYVEMYKKVEVDMIMCSHDQSHVEVDIILVVNLHMTSHMFRGRYR